MLTRSVDNEMVSEILPRATEALKDWDQTSGDLPDEAAFEAMVLDLQEAKKERTNTRVGQRLNYERSGMSSLFRSSGRKADRIEAGTLQGAADRGGQTLGSSRDLANDQAVLAELTAGYYLAAVDAQRTPDGSIQRNVDPKNRIYLSLFGRTLLMSLVITLLTLLLGFPIAYLIAKVPTRIGNLLIILVLLPFWTSLLVRTTAWIALLQQEGVINSFLVAIGILSDDGRLALIHNATGSIIAMTHILLPFMVLPLYSVMKTIPPSYMRAAESLGAHPWRAYWRVYFPADHPRHRGRGHPRLHHRDRLLHHAGAGRRGQRHVHLQSDRIPHLGIAQLGPGGGFGCRSAGGGAGLLPALRQDRRHRQHEAGLTWQRSHPTFRRPSVSGTTPFTASASRFSSS